MNYNDKLQLKAVQIFVFGVLGYVIRYIAFFSFDEFSPLEIVISFIGSIFNLFAILMSVAGVFYFFKGINERFTVSKIISSLVVFGYIGLLVFSILAAPEGF